MLESDSKKQPSLMSQGAYLWSHKVYRYHAQPRRWLRLINDLCPTWEVHQKRQFQLEAVNRGLNALFFSRSARFFQNPLCAAELKAILASELDSIIAFFFLFFTPIALMSSCTIYTMT